MPEQNQEPAGRVQWALSFAEHIAFAVRRAGWSEESPWPRPTASSDPLDAHGVAEEEGAIRSRGHGASSESLLPTTAGNGNAPRRNDRSTPECGGRRRTCLSFEDGAV